MPSIVVGVDKAEDWPVLVLYRPTPRDKFPYWKDLEVDEEFLQRYEELSKQWYGMQFVIKQKLLEAGVPRHEFY